MNEVYLTGYIQEEEFYKSDKFSVAHLVLRVAKSYKKGDTWETENSYIPVDLIGKHFKKYQKLKDKGIVEKGSILSIKGRLKQEKWENNGERRSRLKVYVDAPHHYINAVCRIPKEGGSETTDEDIPGLEIETAEDEDFDF